MWTNKQKIKIRNAIARELQDSGLMNYSLRVEACDTSPQDMAKISFDFHYADLKDERSMIQITKTNIVNILRKCGVVHRPIGEVVVSIFDNTVYYHVFIHFDSETRRG